MFLHEGDEATRSEPRSVHSACEGLDDLAVRGDAIDPLERPRPGGAFAFCAGRALAAGVEDVTSGVRGFGVPGSLGDLHAVTQQLQAEADVGSEVVADAEVSDFEGGIRRSVDDRGHGKLR